MVMRVPVRMGVFVRMSIRMSMLVRMRLPAVQRHVVIGVQAARAHIELPRCGSLDLLLLLLLLLVLLLLLQVRLRMRLPRLLLAEWLVALIVQRVGRLQWLMRLLLLLLWSGEMLWDGWRCLLTHWR